MKRATVVLAVALVTLMAGCSAPPDREETEARTALRQASEAGAETYALQELTLAQAEFDRGLEEKNRQNDRFRPLRSYGAARDIFINSRELAEAALAAANENRQARADESQRLFDQAQRSVQACSDTLAGAPKGKPTGKGTKVDLAMFKDDILMLAEEWEEIRPHLAGGRYDVADSLSLSISRRATALQEEILTAARKRR